MPQQESLSRERNKKFVIENKCFVWVGWRKKEEVGNTITDLSIHSFYDLICESNWVDSHVICIVFII